MSNGIYRVFIKYCVFSKVCHLSLASTWLLLVVHKSHQPIGVLYTRIALRALKASYSDVGEGGVAVSCEKNTIFPEHPVCFVQIRKCRRVCKCDFAYSTRSLIVVYLNSYSSYMTGGATAEPRLCRFNQSWKHIVKHEKLGFHG